VACSGSTATNRIPLAPGRNPAGRVAISDLAASLSQCAAPDANIFGVYESKRLLSDMPISPGARNRSNEPSQAGGILGGGAYAAQYTRQPSWLGDGHVSPTKRRDEGKEFFIGGGAGAGGNFANVPSVAGGIFGEAFAEAFAIRAAPKNVSQPSLAGGIFRAPTPGLPAQRSPQRKNSNISSLPGGIFAR